MKRFLLFLQWLVLLTVTAAHAEESFVVSDIRVEGLQRISAASVFASLPVNVGDKVDPVSLRAAIRTLFRTGNFDDMSVSRDGTILVVSVKERPSISEINLEGNKAIQTDALMKGLASAGLEDGKVFKRSTLEGMQMELTRQYVSQGRYDAAIDTDVVSLPRNRVAVNINIDEGTPAAIKQINIVGNSVYSDEDLLSLFELDTTGWFSWLTSDDKYAKEKLSGDLETLTSYYMDSGYIRFSIESTQVSVTPDRDAVFITVNLDEGDKYQVGTVDLSGDLVVPEEDLRRFVFFNTGETFSQARVTDSEEWISKRLGNEGYNFAKVEGIPDIDEESKTVNIKLFIDPGKRTYVRRIRYDGNTRTRDEVLRREMRQMESAPASSAAIETSKVRLERLGYFKEVNVDTIEVPGTDDLIDLVYTVEEQPSGSIGASVGFSQDSGLLFGASLQQDNFFGSGNSVGISANKSDYLTNIQFSYLNPYYTKDGVSRGFSVSYSEADLDQINVSRYSTNTLGASINFGYPISEIERLGFALGYMKSEITVGEGAAQEIFRSPIPYKPSQYQYATRGMTYYLSQLGSDGKYTGPETLLPIISGLDYLYNVEEKAALPVYNLRKFDYSTGTFEYLGQLDEPGFLEKYGNEFDNYTFTINWSQSTLNRGLLATRGAQQALSLELTVPGSDLNFYKLRYNGQIFLPVTQSWIVRLKTELGYGDGYNGDELPFFNHFYSGGFSSVRGYRSNTLGPRSTPAYRYDLGQAALAVNPDGTSALTDYYNLSYILQPGENNFSYSAYDVEGDPFGGNILVEGSLELLFPLPFLKDQRSVRSAFFVDAGNVFSSHCRSTQLNCFDVDLGELRYSYGVGLTWITGFGPLTFSYAKPINETEYDEIESFQFSLGRSF